MLLDRCSSFETIHRHQGSRMRLRHALASCLPWMVACGTDPDDFGRCTGDLAISVSAEVAPEFSWTPTDCRIYDVVVEQATVIYWTLTSTESVNGIQGPVRYGEPARPGTIGGGEGARLIPGNRYLVRVYRIDNGLLGVAGEHFFVYQPASQLLLH
jgi:hypothetical protein